MKFKKIKLDEDLPQYSINPNTKLEVINTDIDDDYFGMEYPESMFEQETAPQVTEGPELGPNVGIADVIMSSINDEFNTIRNYNSLIATMQNEDIEDYSAFIKVIQDINVEENKHVGQLQEILKQISPNATQIEAGKDEAQEQMAEPVENSTTASASDDTAMCTLSDVDDEM